MPCARDNLTGKRERSRDREMSVDEEDTLPGPAVDREITGDVHERCAMAHTAITGASGSPQFASVVHALARDDVSASA